MNEALNTTPRRISAATLRVPQKPSIPAVAPASVAPVSNDRSAIFDGLNRLIEHCGPKPNKHDLVLALIAACVGDGVNTAKQIIGVLHRLGFNNKHVAMMLKEGTGMNPESARWRLNGDKTYSLLS